MTYLNEFLRSDFLIQTIMVSSLWLFVAFLNCLIERCLIVCSFSDLILQYCRNFSEKYFTLGGSGGPEKDQKLSGCGWFFMFLHPEFIMLTGCLGIMVTLLAWMQQRLESLKSPTR